MVPIPVLLLWFFPVLMMRAMGGQTRSLAFFSPGSSQGLNFCIDWVYFSEFFCYIYIYTYIWWTCYLKEFVRCFRDTWLKRVNYKLNFQSFQMHHSHSCTIPVFCHICVLCHGYPDSLKKAHYFINSILFHIHTYLILGIRVVFGNLLCFD